MIYHNGKRYVLMKDGVRYEEARSATPISKADYETIQTYFSTHTGKTLIEENGQDWTFVFDPIPVNIIEAIKNSGYSLCVQYSSKTSSSMMKKNWDNKRNDVLKKRGPLKNMRIPWIEEVDDELFGYCTTSSLDKEGNQIYGRYRIAKLVSIQELINGKVTIPELTQFHRTRQQHAIPLKNALGKLTLIFGRECLFNKEWDTELTTNKNGGTYYDATVTLNACVMDSDTVVRSKPLRPSILYIDQNSVHTGGTLDKKFSFRVKTNEDVRGEVSMYVDAKNEGAVQNHDAINCVQFTVNSYAGYEPRIISKKLGLNFKTSKKPIEPNDITSGAVQEISPRIVLTEDIDDLEILIEE